MKERTWLDTVLLVVLAGSVALNVVASYRYRDIRSALALSERKKEVVPTWPPLVVRTLSGERHVLDWAERERMTLLYIVAPDCGWCEANAASIRHLLSSPGRTFDIVMVSVQEKGFEKYLANWHQVDEAYLMTQAAHLRGYRLGTTPHTILIGTDGRVRGEWPGAYSARIASEMAAVLEVPVPVADGL